LVFAKDRRLRFAYISLQTGSVVESYGEHLMSLLSQFFRSLVIVIAIGFTVIFVSSMSFAQQQNIQSLMDRLERLERDIRTLNVQLSRGKKPKLLESSSDASSVIPTAGPAIARLGARMDGFEADMRTATGTIEYVNHQIIAINERLEKLVSDIDYRFLALEGQSSQKNISGQQGVGTPNSSVELTLTGEQVVTPSSGAQTLGNVSLSEIKKVETAKINKLAGMNVDSANSELPAPLKGILPAGTVKEQYKFAFNLLRQTNYDLAEVALKEFLSAHSGDPLVSNARYWLGETYYVRKSFRDAAQIFLEGFTKTPKGPKAAASLLKLGMSLAELGKKIEACTTFAKVMGDFPKVSNSVKNEVVRQRKRNSCP
jgi:tol-pal system protein YbgF